MGLNKYVSKLKISKSLSNDLRIINLEVYL